MLNQKNILEKKLILLGIKKQKKEHKKTKMQLYFSLLKKRKKQLYIFQKEQLNYYSFILF